MVTFKERSETARKAISKSRLLFRYLYDTPIMTRAETQNSGEKDREKNKYIYQRERNRNRKRVREREMVREGESN